METGDFAVMGTVKLAACLFILFLFQTVGKLNVQDDAVWFGLCVVLSAYLMYQPAEDRIFIEEKEDEDE